VAAARVRRDVREGLAAGVAQTPTAFTEDPGGLRLLGYPGNVRSQEIETARLFRRQIIFDLESFDRTAEASRVEIDPPRRATWRFARLPVNIRVVSSTPAACNSSHRNATGGRS